MLRNTAANDLQHSRQEIFSRYFRLECMNVLFSIEVKISGIVIVAADMDKFVGGG